MQADAGFLGWPHVYLLAVQCIERAIRSFMTVRSVHFTQVMMPLCALAEIVHHKPRHAAAQWLCDIKRQAVWSNADDGCH